MERKLRQDNSPLRRRHMGLASAIIVISQIITQFFSSSLSNKNINGELQQIRIDQEKYSNKIDNIRRDLSEMDSQIRSIKKHVSVSNGKSIRLSQWHP